MKPERMSAARATMLHPPAAHHHAPPAGMRRRQFLKTAAGAGAIAAGLGLARVGATGPGPGQLLPIPTTVEFFPGVASHVQAPPFLVGPDSDPSTVYNFKGASAIGFVTGECQRRNRKTGETRTLPYIFNDMRFMQGTVRNRKHEHPVTLGFI